ncbi:hypothetical protein SM124_14990 [Bacillus sp. 31A1R]|uniref:Uncharacterized protein n=1 Tax=Robertmurraya mangrovi TaxID=3098077 RepID=A0ABU5J0U0_9BACI|nr:hypothetical protein [Bacillus sp. 31A1R]MDZ5473022.1 hypothetical protein [Bacillus sp. 31A1R]
MMNTPEQNKKNLLIMKTMLSELIFSLSISWIVYWILYEVVRGYEWTSIFATFISIQLLHYFKLSLKNLYMLCISALLIAVLVTLLI